MVLPTHNAQEFAPRAFRGNAVNLVVFLSAQAKTSFWRGSSVQFQLDIQQSFVQQIVAPKHAINEAVLSQFHTCHDLCQQRHTFGSGALLNCTKDLTNSPSNFLLRSQPVQRNICGTNALVCAFSGTALLSDQSLQSISCAQ